MIPDPIERMEAQQEHLMNEWNRAQKNVPESLYRCPYCSRLFAYEPIALDSHPASPVMCYHCLPDEVKRRYDKFNGR